MMASDSLQKAVGERMQDLLGKASDDYAGSRNHDALRAYAEAASLAESLGDSKVTAHARCWEGITLHGLGRLREALIAFGASLRGSRSIADDKTYLGVTRYIRAMIELPAPVEMIERAMRDAENALEGVGRPDRRARILLNQARLCLSRGMYREALSASQQGLIAWERESHAPTASSYFWQLVLVCIWLRETELAHHYLEEWSEREKTNLAIKRSYIACRQSDLARSEGRVADAVGWARRARREGASLSDYPVHISVDFALTRSLLLKGECEAAREPLAALLGLRQTEIGEHGYAIRVLRADFHLARARRLAGLPMIDPEFGVQYRPRAGKLDLAAAHRELGIARRLYGVAKRVGRRLDHLLLCDLRSREIEARYRLVDEAARLGSQKTRT
jgi:tetratricopeptide (TPR) repeat protein